MFLLVSTLLDDSHQLLCSAKGLPDTLSARRVRKVYLRAALVLSWLAIEESVRSVAGGYKGRGLTLMMPTKLSQAVIFLLALNELSGSLADPEFPLSSDEYDAMDRNRIGSINEAQLDSYLKQATEEFDMGAFLRMRKLRNDLLHLNSEASEPTIETVDEGYRFARAIIEVLEGKPIVHRWLKGGGELPAL